MGHPVVSGFSNVDPVIAVILAIVGGAIVLGLAIALIVVSVKVTGGILSAAFWLVKHVATFVVGTLGDAGRLIGAILAAVIALPIATVAVVFGRWDGASRWGRALRRETLMIGWCLWSIVARRPLQLLCLDGVLDGIERRLPEASAGAVVGPPPRPGTPASFEGYEIEGTLRPGGSGAKLYVAAPDAERRKRIGLAAPAKVVLKSFALEEGSSLPQIVRESRALDSARAMGLILDHGLDAGRFWYAMPYHPGESLAETTRLLHARSGPEGLEGADLAEAISYVNDVVATLSRYHDGGLWHKDVKPDNIMVHDGKAHVVDLGLVTPLRSAMTLTTHGTEYFRDPEMVRQALRGVKVHQVDGGKFDVYGAGAVLYFVLENTFPAHGGLSSFTRRSPEALRWIIRRAMADYQQRYPSARAMLDDLATVVAARDPWTVRPADLPSMRGDAPSFASASMPPRPAMGNGGWMPPPAPPSGVGAGVAVASFAARPRLTVTNWWTGAYASAAAGAVPAAWAVAGGHPAVAPGAVGGQSWREARRSARKAAKDAHQAARQAVNDAKRRSRRDPPAIASLIPLVAIIVTVLVAINVSRGSRSSASVDGPTSIVARSAAPAALAPPAAGAKLVVLNDHPTAANPETEALVAEILASYAARGFSVVRDDTETVAKLTLAVEKGRGKDGPDAEAAAADVDAVLATAGYWGAILVDAAEGAGAPNERLVAIPIGTSLVKATEAVAKNGAERKPKSTKAAKPAEPVDVPARSDPPLPPVPPIGPDANRRP